MRYAKTEWGIKVKIFTHRYGITLKRIAIESGVNYNTLLTVMVGKTSGDKSDLITKVDSFMADVAAKTDHMTRLAIRTIPEYSS